MAQNRKTSKGISGLNENGKKSKESSPDNLINSNSQISAPKFGTMIPDRVFVGGISSNTTGNELTDFFSKYGKVVEAKIISDRGGVSKGYGFITFSSEEEAKQLLSDAENIILRERKLNIAPAIKKQNIYSRVDGSSTAAGGGLFQTGVPPYAYHANGMAYFSPQPPPQLPPPPTPPPSQHHIDPSIYTGYSAIQAAPPQYHHPIVYNQPVYYQPPQYQYPVSCDGSCDGLIDNTGTLMMTPSSYYMQEVMQQQQQPAIFAQEYIQPQTYHPHQTYQPHQFQQPTIHDPALLQFSPRRYYDSVIIPEPQVGGVGGVMVVRNQEHEKEDRGGSQVEQKQHLNNSGGTPALCATTPASNNNNPDHANRNLIHNNPSNPPPVPPQVQGYQFYRPHLPQPQQPPSHNHSVPFNIKRIRHAFNQGNKKPKRYSHGGGSVSSYSSGGGGGGGLMTPPSTPRSDVAAPTSPAPPPTTTSDLQPPPPQEHLVKPMQALKAA